MDTDASQTSTVNLKRLSQVAAVASSSRLEETIDWLLPMLAYFSTRPWHSADDWFDEIKNSYGIDVSLHDIGESLGRLRERGTLIWDGSAQVFTLAEKGSNEIQARLEDASDLEDNASAVWLDAVRDSLPPGRSDREWWQLLMDYCAPVFRLHGIDAVQVLTDAVPSVLDDDHAKILNRVLDERQVADGHRDRVKAAIAYFFNSGIRQIDTYVSQLADSTYNLLALCVDDESRRLLLTGIPELRVFVDTNILFSLLGTHDTPLAAASIDLFRVIRDAKLPFKLYYHPKTLAELTHTIEDAQDRLRRQSWSQTVSRAVVRLPWQVTRVSGIEMRFHQLNAKSPTDPVAFCARYQAPIALLAEHGLHIYREPNVNESQDRLELRSTIIADYREYLSKNPRRRNSPYAKLDHDCSVWMVSKEMQTSTRKGVLFSGAFFLSSDYSLWRFDRDVMRRMYGSRPVVVLPDALLQSLRPFVGGSRFDDRAFVRAFSASEFRAGGNSTALAATVRRVMSYLAVFADLPEETAIRILSDNILMEGLKRYEENAPEFVEAINRAIFQHAEALARERDELLSEREAQMRLAQKALAESSPDNKKLNETLRFLVETFQAGPTNNPVINLNTGMVNMNQGHTFQNSQSQIGAQGAGASATNNTFTQQVANLNDPALIQDLMAVKGRLLVEAHSSDDFDAIACVQGAIEAIEAKDDSKAAGFLKRAGHKALDVAIELGAKAASAAIQAQLGIGS